MAKIEIDDQKLKKVICDAFVEMMTTKSTAVVWEEGDPGTDWRDAEITTLRKQVANYKTMLTDYKTTIAECREKIADKDKEVKTLVLRNRDLCVSGRACEEENKKLAREIDRLTDDVQAYKEVVCDLTKACNKVKGDIDQEFEETVRGNLMNLKLVKKYLDKVLPFAKTKDEYLKAMGIIDKDISNLDKFVEERWGHDEED